MKAVRHENALLCLRPLPSYTNTESKAMEHRPFDPPLTTMCMHSNGLPLVNGPQGLISNLMALYLLRFDARDARL